MTRTQFAVFTAGHFISELFILQDFMLRKIYYTNCTPLVHLFILLLNAFCEFCTYKQTGMSQRALIWKFAAFWRSREFIE